MKARITQQQLESYLWGAATLLRGTIDAGDYKQFIFPLLFYKRLCDVFDEETQVALKESGGDAAYAAYPENHRLQIPPDAHWREVRTGSTNVGAAIQNAMRAIETANPDKLYGIFGDAQWTNKDRLSDAMLRDLIEHFSSLELTVANLPEDELGNGYEYLIKKFADDSGHTAAEFYTNRTVVHLMTEMLEPQPGESIYDPTCGSGGMLLSAIAHLKRQGKEWRNVRLYGQERNLMTSSIARMNCFLHGIEDFQIVRGDTLSGPKFVEGDRLMQFDVVLANPPYSIKQWDRDAFASDPWGRNLYGTPPQGRADYAFQQHIACSMKPKTGRSVALWPHGLLSREEEADIRQKLVASDLVEAVIGLGRKLFYNSGMESCLLVCRREKDKGRKGKVLFIDAERYVHREHGQSFLSDDDISSILEAYRNDKPIPGLSVFATNEEILANKGNLNIKLYVESSKSMKAAEARDSKQLEGAALEWLASRKTVCDALNLLDSAVVTPDDGTRVVEDVLSSPVFDQSTSTRVKLKDVASEYAERVDDPSSSSFDRYVGSDCIDRFDFRIRRWDPASSVSSSMKAFRLGDYLLVRRSLYGSDFRERAPRADFSGLCSADILTLREEADKIADGFLIAVLYNPKLWQYVVAHAKGSLTRRIKWRELAEFEFDLPPLEKQRRIAQMLWTLDAVLSAYVMFSDESRGARKRTLMKYMGDLVRTCPRRPLREIGEIQLGRQRAPKYTTGRYSKKYLRVVNVLDGKLDLRDIEEMDFNARDFERYRLVPGDILVTEGDITSPYNVGRSAVFRGEVKDCCFQNTLIRFRAGSDLLPEFAQLALQHAFYRGEFAAVSSTTTVTHLGAQRFGTVAIPVPTIEVQRDVARRMAELDSILDAAEQHVSNTRRLLAILSETLALGGVSRVQ